MDLAYRNLPPSLLFGAQSAARGRQVNQGWCYKKTKNKRNVISIPVTVLLARDAALESVLLVLEG